MCTYSREVTPDVIASNDRSTRGHADISSQNTEGGGLAGSINS